MARFKAVGSWDAVEKHGSFFVQEADALDTKTGTVFSGGASRVVDARNEMKPVRGKGGTMPFLGETAWGDARRLASDLALEEMYGR